MKPTRQVSRSIVGELSGQGPNHEWCKLLKKRTHGSHQIGPRTLQPVDCNVCLHVLQTFFMRLSRGT